jgi:hypothetical protein
MNHLTFGCDPEVFATYRDKSKFYVFPPVAIKRDLGITPSIIDRTLPPKNHDVYLKVDGEYQWIHDGVAFELNTFHPFETAIEMNTLITDALGELDKFISSLGLILYQKPVVAFDPKRFYHNRDDEFIGCVIFGCDADHDAILGDANCKVLNVEKHPYRYGGGHIHLGSENPDDIDFIHNNILQMVRLLAITMGNVCIAGTKYLELEKFRAKYYGKPGRFRPQKWGVEYRTPSNSWMSSFETQERIFDAGNYAFYLLQHPDEGEKILDKYLGLTIQAIEESNQELSKSIVHDLNF